MTKTFCFLLRRLLFSRDAHLEFPKKPCTPYILFFSYNDLLSGLSPSYSSVSPLPTVIAFVPILRLRLYPALRRSRPYRQCRRVSSLHRRHSFLWQVVILWGITAPLFARPERRHVDTWWMPLFLRSTTHKPGDRVSLRITCLPSGTPGPSVKEGAFPRSLTLSTIFSVLDGSHFPFGITSLFQ